MKRYTVALLTILTARTATAISGEVFSTHGRRLLCGLLDGIDCGDGCPYLSSCQNGFCIGLVAANTACGGSTSGTTGTIGTGITQYTAVPPPPPPPLIVDSPPPPPVDPPPPPPPDIACPPDLNVWSKDDEVASACFDDCQARGKQVCVFSHNTIQVLSTICAASVYVEQLTPFCAGGLYAEGKDYCNNECIDPCANIPQAACLIAPVPFYCQDTCLSAGVTLVDGVAKLTSDLSNSASNAGLGVVNCITNAFGGGCG